MPTEYRIEIIACQQAFPVQNAIWNIAWNIPTHYCSYSIIFSELLSSSIYKPDLLYSVMKQDRVNLYLQS